MARMSCHCPTDIPPYRHSMDCGYYEAPLEKLKEEKVSDTTLEEITELVTAEQENWAQLGLSIEMIKPSNEQIFTMSTRLECLCYFLVQEQRLPNEEEFNIKLNEIVLGYLRNIREKVEPGIMQARAMQAGLAVPEKPQLVDQFGQKFEL